MTNKIEKKTVFNKSYDNTIAELVCNMSLDRLQDLLIAINNNRSDIYVEYLDTNDYDKSVLQECKDYEYNLIDTDTLFNKLD